MSLRPRFAGDGRLRLPAWVSILRVGDADGDIGDIVGTLGGRDWDPFERTDEGLLLAEAFARVDLERPRKAQQWYVHHGVLDLAHLFSEEDFERRDWPPGNEGFHDAPTDVLDQQSNVRWHLLALARLSAERARALPPLPGWQPHQGWDPRWAQPALQDPRGGVLWLGGATNFEARITSLMQQYPRFEDVPNHGPLEDWNLDRVAPTQFTEQWWPTAHAAWQRIQQDAIPILWVPADAWDEQWDDEAYEIDGWAPHPQMLAGRLSADWHGLLELERRLLDPYVRRAASHEVWVRPRGSAVPPSREGEPPRWQWDGPIEVREHRWWRSLLAPVYLQLLEGLRRISEGHSGAAFCRECGQPFLTLDARRSSFCNDRERFRFTQRERRKRLAAPPPNVPRGMPR